jgi:FAD:protein FMN transferase
MQRARPAMGTFVHIAASGNASEAVESAIENAFETIAQVERLMSFHDRNSELSRLNRAAHRQPQSVHPWIYAVIKRALQLSDASAGMFDLTVAPLLVKAGLLPHTNELETHGGNWRAIKLLEDNRIFFEQPVLLDLGGIAKGFAVDQAIHALRRAGCTEAVVNAGGDLRRFGKKHFPLYLRRNLGPVQVAELRCGAVATSSPHANIPDRISQPLGCIVNPIQQHAWRGKGSVMVAARSCVIADALTKVAALAGPACQSLLNRFGAQAIWDTDDNV